MHTSREDLSRKDLSKEELAAFAREKREEIVSVTPFRVRRAVRWSECDPAGVVYAGNFPEYMLSAIHLFRRHVFDAAWRDIRTSTGTDMPAKAMSMVFNGSLWPDDVFDIEVHTGEVRTRSFDFEAIATRAENGSNVFEGRMTAICVSAENRGLAVPIPGALRARLEQWKRPTDA